MLSFFKFTFTGRNRLHFRKQEIEMLHKLAGSGAAEAKRLAFARRDPASLWTFCKFTFTGRNRLHSRKQEIEMLNKLAHFTPKRGSPSASLPNLQCTIHGRRSQSGLIRRDLSRSGVRHPRR